jgi:hypothetical protein
MPLTLLTGLAWPGGCGGGSRAIHTAGVGTLLPRSVPGPVSSRTRRHGFPMTLTTIKTKNAADFLALVPQLVGFQPEQSLVLVAFRGNRSCGALRFNLPGRGAGETVLRRIATTLVGTLCKIVGADAVVPVVYTSERFEQRDIPQGAIVFAVMQRAELSGFEVKDALCVASNGWGSYLDPSIPRGGRPLAEVRASPVVAAAAAGGRPLGSLHQPAELPKVDIAARKEVAQVFARYRRLASSAGKSPGLLTMVGDVVDPVDAAEAALEWDLAGLVAKDAAVVLFIVQAPAVRDQVMLQFAFGRGIGIRVRELNSRYAVLQRTTGRSLDDIVGEEMLARQHNPAALDDARAVESGEGAADLIMGLTDRRPDVERIGRALAMLKHVVALAPRSARPAPLCMLAWLSWAMGRGSVAGLFLDRAFALDREYPMALLLHALLGSGHLPAWAFEGPPQTATDAGAGAHPK